MENNKKVFDNMKQSYQNTQMPKEAVEKMRQQIKIAKTANRIQNQRRMVRYGMAGAAVLAVILFVLPNTSQNIAYAMSKIPVLSKVVEVVTIREYHFEDERNFAEIEVPEMTITMSSADGDGTTEERAPQEEVLEESVDAINQQIEKIADQFLAEFKASVKEKDGYQDVRIKSEVVTTTKDFFTLKLNCYQGAGSGAEWNYYYTIDLNSGKQMKLEDLFVKNSNYKKVISENIKEQMRQQMQEDENVVYWLDDEEIPEWNFETISEDVEFYLNEEGDVVICFDEGEVAPMYMGCVEFEISQEVLSEIMK